MGGVSGGKEFPRIGDLHYFKNNQKLKSFSNKSGLRKYFSRNLPQEIFQG